MPFAEKTGVPVERSRAEIERMLMKAGATRFGSQWNPTTAMIAFEVDGRRVRFILPLPKLEDFKAPRKGRYSPPSETEVRRMFEREERRRWRALALVIKAKLEAVASGVSAFEDEFLAHFILPNGDTVGDWLRPQIAETYKTGGMPPLLGSGK